MSKKGGLLLKPEALSSVENQLKGGARELMEKVEVPAFLNFIWIGECSDADLDYIPVWQRFNPDMIVHLWSDDSASLCRKFHLCLQRWCAIYPEQRLNELQNRAFSYIYPKVISGDTFNSSAVSFLNETGINHKHLAASNNNEVLFLPENIVPRNILSLFEGGQAKYRKIYYYELILRGNLASASDIIRLLILFRFGGVYLDIDTLPDISGIFLKTRQVEITLGLENDERTCLAKSAAFMAWFKGCNDVIVHAEKYLPDNTSLSENNLESLKESIIEDLRIADDSSLTPLGKIKIYPDYILIGSVDFLPGIFFNNFLCAYPGSRLVRIILKTIYRHYTFLENNNAIFARGNILVPGQYCEILQGYRRRFDSFSDPITRWLTGPGAIIDTLTSLIYRLIPEAKVIPSEELGVLLQREEYNLTIKKQTLDTPMGLK